MKLYAGFVIAFSRKESGMLHYLAAVCSIVAENDTVAQAEAFSLCLQRFPKDEGWVLHESDVKEIQQNQIKEAMN